MTNMYYIGCEMMTNLKNIYHTSLSQAILVKIPISLYSWDRLHICCQAIMLARQAGF